MKRIDFERRKENKGPPAFEKCEWCGYERHTQSRLACPECGCHAFKIIVNERRKSCRTSEPSAFGSRSSS